MSDRLISPRTLPCQAERQKIIEQAQRVLTKARAIAQRWDQVFAPFSPNGSPTLTPVDGDS